MSSASAQNEKEVEADPRIGNVQQPRSDGAMDPEPHTDLNIKPEDKFTFSPAQLRELLNPKSLSTYRALGGLIALERGLRTDRRSGLGLDETILDGSASFEGVNASMRTASIDAFSPNSPNSPNTTQQILPTRTGGPPDGPFADRKYVFRDNAIPRKKPLSIFRLIWMAYNDQVLFLLTAAAIVSLAIGLYQTFGPTSSPTATRVGWVEGVAIIVAIVIIVLVGAVNDWERQRQFAKLDKKKQDRDVKVVRSGISQMIPIFDVLVGDVVHLEPGDVIPADGIFIDGYNVTCDESSTSGESILVPKVPGEEVFQVIQDEEVENVDEMDPFIISGTKVAEGVGTFMVTATGVNSTHGMTLMSLHNDPDFTPLQVKLNDLAKYIAKSGAVAALILFVVLFIKFLVELPHSTNTPAEKGQNFLNLLIIALTVLVIAVPEGLPLAVTLALAFASNKMLQDHILVRQLKACETMGNSTQVCTDKTGTLTQNKMTVAVGAFGTTLKFDDNLGASLLASKLETSLSSQEKSGHSADVPLLAKEFVGCLASDVKEVLKQSIALNATAFEGEVDGQRTFIGSQTETALLTFARTYLGLGPVNIERSNASIIQIIPFDATRQSMAVIIERETGHYRLYIKGASEVILRKCTRVIRDPSQDLSSVQMSAASEEYLNQVITDYASRALRTISLAYKDFDQWPPATGGIPENSATDALSDDIFDNLTFLGITGIQDPLRDGARDAVEACQKAGVTVRMVTGDNIHTARAIAEQCGIMSASADDTAMEGSEFRNLSEAEMDRVIHHLKVLARSSPEDKRTLVSKLKEKDEIVAVTGDGTNDALALKAADISFSMAISGTEVAREASSIVLMDDNFASIVESIRWGRAINNAVKQFLQFQITVTISSVGLTFVSAVADSQEQSVLTAVQLMWINLFQDTMAALALATDPPSPTILDRDPDPKSAALINIAMWKMILGQSVYQMVILLILYFKGAAILSYHTDHELAQLQTMVFNTYVWMQIFNMYNNRTLNNKFNIFEGIWRNWFFIMISLIMIGGQILIVFVGGRAFSITRLDGAQWAISVVLGAISLPVGVLIRVIPDRLFDRRTWSF